MPLSHKALGGDGEGIGHGAFQAFISNANFVINGVLFKVSVDSDTVERVTKHITNLYVNISDCYVFFCGAKSSLTVDAVNDEVGGIFMRNRLCPSFYGDGVCVKGGLTFTLFCKGTGKVTKSIGKRGS